MTVDSRQVQTRKSATILHASLLVLALAFSLLLAAPASAMAEEYAAQDASGLTAAADSSTKAKPKRIANAKVLKLNPVTYNGNEFKPNPSVTYQGKGLVEGRDYVITYKSNKNAGKARVIIRGKGNYTGKKVVTFKIKKASIHNASFSSIAPMKYTGKDIEPKPTVTMLGKTLVLGTDYKLKYFSNKNVGTARVIVKGFGNYKGNKRITFEIRK